MESESLGSWKRSCAWRLHPKTMKVRKGNVGTSVEWRLNSENDSRLHGQPSLADHNQLLDFWFLILFLLLDLYYSIAR
jgi:hypothetical protein